MPQQEMVDRIAAFMTERDGRTDSETIARDFLRLAGAGGPAARSLVRAVLSQDARFAEVSEGIWHLAERPSALAPPVLLCAIEIPPGSNREPWLWRLSGTLWGGDRVVFSHQGHARSSELDGLLEWLQQYPVASMRPGSLGRWVGAQERLHAFPETDQCVIDLRGWQRLLGSRAAVADGGAHAVRADADGAVSDDEERDRQLGAAAHLMDQLVQAAVEHGLRSWREVALAPMVERGQARDQAWKREWAFTREDVAGLSEGPGIYRLFARDGDLLYVGKAKNLRQRVSSYFRPLDDRSGRREELLRRLHRFKTETTGTELEALMREARTIRESRPAWNVAVELGSEPSEFPAGERDVLLLVPDVNGSFTFFALSGPRVATGSLAVPGDVEALCEALRLFYSEQTVAAGFEEIGAPERLLVRRWMNWCREENAVFRLTDFATFRSLADALLRMASEPPGGGVPDRSPVIVRGSE